MSCRRLAWDSDFFGIEVHQLTLSASLAEDLRDLPAGFTQCLLQDSERSHLPLLAAHGFEVADERLTLTKRLDGTTPTLGGVGIRRFDEPDIPALREMVTGLFVRSRYLKVRLLSQQAADSLYQEWIANAVRGTFDNECVGTDGPGHPASFCTLKYHGGGQLARIGLFGVHSKHQGQGLSAQLLSAVAGRVGSRGASTLLVSTQSANVEAVRAYERAGFAPLKRELWLHRCA